MVLRLQANEKDLRRCLLGIHCQLRHVLLSQNLFSQEININIDLHCLGFQSAFYDRAGDLILSLNQLGRYVKQALDVFNNIIFAKYDCNSNTNYISQVISFPAKLLKYALDVLEKEGIIFWTQSQETDLKSAVLQINNEHAYYICQRALDCQLMYNVRLLISFLTDIKQDILSIFDWNSKRLKQEIKLLAIFCASPLLHKDISIFYQ